MDEIRRSVVAAKWRLSLNHFLRGAGWSLFASLLVALAALSLPKIVPLGIDPRSWIGWWLAASLGGGIVVAVVRSWLAGPTSLAAAIELDRRFQLKERVSSAWELPESERSTEIGRALVGDAVQRVRRIEVQEHFPIRPGWRAILPLLPAVAIATLLAFVPDAAQQQSQAAVALPDGAERVQRSARQLQQRLANVQKQLEARGLSDAEAVLRELRGNLDPLTRKDSIDRKDALIRMNDMARTLEQRRERLGGADQAREQLRRLDSLGQGPANKLAKAIQEGDFGQALQQLKELQDKLSSDGLTEQEKRQLLQQLEQLQNKLRQMAESHADAKRTLEEEIRRREAAGDAEGAGKLQRQLDELNAMNESMDRLQEMADTLGECRECLGNGDGEAAASKLSAAARSLEQLAQQVEELEALDEALREIAAAKDAMNCQACGGEGCDQCQAQGWGAGESGSGSGENPDGAQSGFGLGEGQGRGDRPEERTDTGAFDSSVRGSVQAGEAVRTGSAGGPNRPGRSAEEIKDAIRASLSEQADPLTDVRLPRKEREQAREYFEQFRQGR